MEQQWKRKLISYVKQFTRYVYIDTDSENSKYQQTK
jgi:hypothetical protein